MTTYNMSRRVEIRLLCYWNGATSTDESAYFVSAKGAYEYFPPGESYQSAKQVIQQMELVLRNENRRFSPWYSGSVLYPYQDEAGAYHRKIVLQMRIDSGAWENVFTGYVKEPQESYDGAQISFKVWDAGEILRKRFSTPMLQDYIEHDLVIYYLQMAGLVDGVDFYSPDYAEGNFIEPTIQPSTRRIRYSWLDDEAIWDELVDVAQATGARMYIDASGLIHYEKGWNWINLGQDSYRTLSEDHYRSLGYGYSDKAFYDEFVVSYAERFAGDFQEEIWKQETPKMVLPGATEEVIARFSSPAVSVAAPVVNEDYYLLTLEGADATLISGVSINFQVYAQQAVITITNAATVPIFLWNAKFVGQSVSGSPAEQVKRTLTGKNYNRRLEVRGNYYVQQKAQADYIADFLEWWYGTAKPTVSVSKLRGDLANQIGARVKVRSRDATFDGIIIRCGWNIAIADRTVVYTQDLMLVQNDFAGETYFVVGESQFSQGHKLWF